MSQQSEYLDHHFYPVVKVKDNEADRLNYGLNKRILTHNSQVSFEIDILLQALSLVPDDPEIPLV